MSRYGYFNKFPTITYSNTECLDITKRVTFTHESNTVDSFIFYSYSLTQNERPDHLAGRYFDDPYLEWLLYLSNDVVDPYYDWYMNDSAFADYINDKYGSIDTAKAQIKYYRNNWRTDTRTITIGMYDSLLPEVKQYWEPVLDITNAVRGYARKKVDRTFSTNQIITFRVKGTTTNLIPGEIAEISMSAGYNGTAQVIDKTYNSVMVQHIFGPVNDPGYSIISTSYLRGITSNTKVSIVTSIVTANNISAIERDYYSPVTMYDWEVEMNDARQVINVIDQENKDLVTEMLNTMMRE